MRSYLSIIIIFLAGFIVYSCDPLEEEINTDQSAIFTFSTDTVLFDTVLTSVGSITQRIKIFNPNNKAIQLSQLSLGRGTASPYSIVVNGELGKSFENEVILGNDSLLVLVEVLIDPQDENTAFLVKDSLVVTSNGNFSDIKLVAYGQDAIFIDRGVFNCDVTLTKGRPYVIRNFALVDTLCSLTMEPGTRILMDNDAVLAVRGKLLIKGDTANPVIIRNTRLDNRFTDVPGQWNGIFFLDGSNGNEIEHAVISNGQIGLSAGNPENTTVIDLKVKNTLIENMSFAGIFSVNSKIEAVNNVLSNCGTYMVANFGGGDYSYKHCTFSNVPSSFIREQESVQFADFLPVSQTEILVNPIKLELTNNIIWGGLEEELLIAQQTSANEISVSNNLIRSISNWVDSDNFTSTARNFPGFININQKDFRLDSLAFSRGMALPSEVGFDLLQIPRDAQPDLGAYERVDKE